MLDRIQSWYSTSVNLGFSPFECLPDSCTFSAVSKMPPAEANPTEPSTAVNLGIVFAFG